ncbi:MAG: signal peptidase I [Gammaproteobacteria bacterium]
MDLSAIFVLLLLVSGIVLLADFVVFKHRRQRRAPGRVLPEPLLVQYARSFLPVILVVLLVRAFVFEPFRIPSASMMPGLVDGDFIFVNKFSYGLRLPVINTKIVPIGEPRRGDVIVFRLPSDPSVHYIKRLIGSPGDHVVVRDNQLTINGASIPLQRDGAYSGGFGFTGAALALERFGSEQHLIMLAPNRDATDFETVVPAGHYFFMGDNRNDSSDSRFPLVGLVPEQNLVGRAVRIWMNWQLPGWPNWRRIGLKIS